MSDERKDSADKASGAATPVEPTPWREIVQPFVDVLRAPRVLTAINLSYLLEGCVYFGFLSLLAIFFNKWVGLDDVRADWMVSCLAGGITLSMMFLGGVTDRIGVRRSIVLAVGVMLAGRLVMVLPLRFLARGGGIGSPMFWAAAAGMLLVVIGYGLYQPACYAAVRKFARKDQAAMGYAMLYALMNLGGFLPGLISPPVRRRFDIPGVFWVYIVMTGVGLVLFMLLLTRRVERTALTLAASSECAVNETLKSQEEPKQVFRGVGHWLRAHPLADPKFSFFIFCLIPVQTLLAHNWLTLPQYVSRSLGPVGNEYMEFFVNLNPILIFVLTPTVAAITRKTNVYRMMILGTFVMALPTFLLGVTRSIAGLMVYLLINAVGEAMWQPRFLQYAAEIAPKGRTGAYMGVAQFPWFLTKVITGLYAGWFLQRYCPEDPMGQHPERMWLIYGCIAMVSTGLLLAARPWIGKDFKTESA